MQVQAYDLLVIGGGPAGICGANTAGIFGKRVALVEKLREVGGAGINTGTTQDAWYCLYAHRYYHGSMKTITVKIHEALDEKLTLTASAQGISKGELLRRSVDFYFASHPAPARSKKRPTLHDRLKKYIPKKGTGIRDLATNPKYMEGFGAD